MIPLKLRRKYLRAPLHTNFLFKDEHGVHKGIIENISEGGAMLSGLKSAPPSGIFNVFFDMPEIPDFSNLPISDVLSLGRDNFRHNIFSCELETKREFIRPDVGDKCVGVEFFSIDSDIQKRIKNYVSVYASNIVFTLSLFEQGVHRQEVKNLIFKSVRLLNYPPIEKLSNLRQKLLHDYQSLESL